MDWLNAENLSDNDRKEVAQLVDLAVKVGGPDDTVERMLDDRLVRLLKERRDDMIFAFLDGTGVAGSEFLAEAFQRVEGLAANRLMINKAGAHCWFELGAIPVIVLSDKDGRVPADFCESEQARTLLAGSFFQHGLLGEGDEVVIVPRLYSHDFIDDAGFSDIYQLAEEVSKSLRGGVHVPESEPDSAFAGAELRYLLVGHLRAKSAAPRPGVHDYWGRGNDAFGKRVDGWLDVADDLLAKCVGMEPGDTVVGELIHVCGAARAGEDMFCSNMFDWYTESEFEKAGVKGEDVDAHLERVGANGRLVAIDVTYRVRASSLTIGTFTCPLPFHVQDNEEAMDFIMPVLTDLGVRNVTLCGGVKDAVVRECAEQAEHGFVVKEEDGDRVQLH